MNPAGRPRVTDRPHGVRAKYVAEKCRCDDCRKAHRDYENARNRRRAEERWGVRGPDIVDAAPVRQHIQALQAAGMGYKRIAAAAGVSASRVGQLAGVTAPKTPNTRVHATTAAKILAVRPDPGGKQLTAAGPAGRKVRALHAIGWTLTELAGCLGVAVSNFGYHRLDGSHLVRVDTDRKIDAVYRELHMTPAPDTSGARAARHRAQVNGWPPPLAWDDIDAGTMP